MIVSHFQINIIFEGNCRVILWLGTEEEFDVYKIQCLRDNTKNLMNKMFEKNPT